jgi:hypothetical protein
VTTSADIADAIYGLLVAGATLVGENVFSPRALPTDLTQLGQCLLLQTPSERKENVNGRNGPAEFFVHGAFRVVGRLQEKARAGDASAMVVEARLGALQQQVEGLVINAPALRKLVQAFDSVEVSTTVKRDGEFVFGEVVLTFGLEFFQGAEAFAQPDLTALAEIAIYADLVNRFSATDDVSDPDEIVLFPGVALPAPRTSGPDGRPEAKVLFSFGSDLDFEDPANSGVLPAL